jgi:hypothetical protein
MLVGWMLTLNGRREEEAQIGQWNENRESWFTCIWMEEMNGWKIHGLFSWSSSLCLEENLSHPKSLKTSSTTQTEWIVGESGTDDDEA